MRAILLIAGCLLFLAASVAAQPGLAIVPKPADMQPLAGTFEVNAKTRILADDGETRNIASFLNDAILRFYGVKLPYESKAQAEPNTILLTTEGAGGLPEEGYKLTIDKAGVKIVGRGAGLFYGAQTLLQLLPPPPAKLAFKVPGVEINDAPRFRYRGLHLDVGRHLFPVEFIKKYIDLMAQYKLNYFHWHLTEDQGWRIEIKKYPKLTEIGSQRKETVKDRNLMPYIGDGKPYGGFYTQEQIKDVVAYAQARYVTIVPEIEMPGHSLAALAAYPELGCTPGPFEVSTTWGIFPDIYCPKEETFTFLQDVLTEVIALFPGPYIHIGGDEAPKDRWKASPVAQAIIKREGLKDEHELQSYFIRRLGKFLNAKGKRLIGWDEILEGGLAPDATVMSWRGETGGIAAAKQKHDVVMTPSGYLYLDHYQGDPKYEPLNIGGYTTLARTYSYNPTPAELTPEEQKYIIGAQGNVWTEYLKTPELVEYMAFPRALALAEMTWTPQAKRNYEDFAARLPAQFARLDVQKVNYRIPDPTGLTNEVQLADKPARLTLTPAIPGSKIYYTINGSDPGKSSARYGGPIEAKARPGFPTVVSTRTVTPNGRQSSIATATIFHGIYREADTTVAADKLKPGLNYNFYEGRFGSSRDMMGLTPKSSGVSGLDIDQFTQKYLWGIIWEGYLKVPADGLYQFVTISDDGSTLAIDGEQIVDNDGAHKLEQRFGMLPLRQGFHRVRVAYLQQVDTKSLRVLWGQAGQTMRPLDKSALFH